MEVADRLCALGAEIQRQRTDQNGQPNDRQDEATYGVGARWNFSRNWGLFAEWMKNDRIRVDSYLAGIDFRF